MRYLFFNGPVQNGSFTFEEAPGKAVGIRIARALNTILDTPPVPHLWNTVTLAGDRRHRESAASPVARAEFEAGWIAAKYGIGPASQAGIVTDADDEVADLAMKMLEDRLATGALTISRETVRVCAGCGHMTGTGSHACKACGCVRTRAHTTRHLVAERDPSQPVLSREHIHASKRRPPLHLQNVAGNVPRRLILSRTRDHGIDLAPLGLEGQVLDPRVGVHITVLAAASRPQADIAVMTTTPKAAINVAAYGQHFRDHDGLRVLYALHGHVPYQQKADLQAAYEAYRPSTAARSLFETWFLPLYSLKEKSGVRADQLPALFKHFRRGFLTRPAEPDEAVLEGVRQSVRDGDTGWMTRKTALANAMGPAAA